MIRFDVKPINNDTIYWKYQWWTSDNLGTGTSGWPGNDNNRWGINSHYLYKDDGWSANWVRVINASVVNEFNFGMRHDSEGFIPGDGEIERVQRAALNYTAPQLFPQNNHLGTIPRVTNWGGVRGPTNGVANINWLDRWGEVGNDYIKPSFADNLSITHGDHAFKFGVYYERLLNGEAPGGQWSGVFNFAGNDSNYTAALGNTSYAYANALIGNFRNYQESTARPFTNLRSDAGAVVRGGSVEDSSGASRSTTVCVLATTRRSNRSTGRDLTLFRLYSIERRRSRCTRARVQWRSLRRRLVPQRSARARIRSRANYSTWSVRTPVSSARSFRTAAMRITVWRSESIQTPLRVTGTRKPIDYEPRLGFAWDVFGAGKSVLRFQAGIYHAPRVGGGTTGGNLVNNQPANRSLSIDFGNINQLASLTGTALTRPSALNAVEENRTRRRSTTSRLALQQDIGFQTVMEVSYVGSFARHLGQRININGVPDGARLGTNNIDPGHGPAHRLTTSCGRIAAMRTSTWSSGRGTSNYNSLQVQIGRRYTQGFQYGLAYTYSKSFDYANDDSSDVFLWTSLQGSSTTLRQTSIKRTS